MIEHLSLDDQTWLARFFASPNELSWSSLLDGSAPRREADEVRHWLGFLDARPSAPLILPFMRGGTVTGWYATTQQSSGGYELGDELNAWLGPTWLSRLERVTDVTSDPFAAVLADRFHGTVYRFTGADTAAIHSIADLLSEYASVLSRKPATTRRRVRPVGAIRSDFERALIAGDEGQAEAMIAELKLSGRLNEENLRYLEVRLSAGLGLWPQIARDHWLIKTLADLALPPQVLADLIEALYRTYIDDAEMACDAAGMQEAFAREIATPYPKLFASRRGIRTPRVLKAFALYEQLQAKPDSGIIGGLLAQLPADSDTTLFHAPPVPDAYPPADTSLDEADEADEAFDDGQFDRAFEFYLRLTPSRKTVSRLVSCVGTIGTDDAKGRLLELLASAEPSLLVALAPAVTAKIESFRSFETVAAPGVPEATEELNGVDPWMRWGSNCRAARISPKRSALSKRPQPRGTLPKSGLTVSLQKRSRRSSAD